MEIYQRILERKRLLEIEKVGKAYEENPIEIDPSLGQLHYKDYLNYIRSKTCLGLYDSWVFLLSYLHNKRYDVGMDIAEGDSFSCCTEIIDGEIVNTYKIK